MNPRRVIKRLVPKSVFMAIAPYGHLAEAVVYNCIYGFPAKNMKVIGITGTNGKTTTSFMVHRMLSEAGYKAGLMTTVAWAVGNEIRPQTQHMTNVPVPLLMKRLKQMKAEGVEWLVLETTSHALVQYRTWGVPYSVAVLTNITREHLDYHKTFERYVEAKQRLFKLAQRNKKGLQMGIANADDQNGPSFASETQNSILYGIEAGAMRATNIKMTAKGVRYDAVCTDETYHIASKLPGSFNVYNSLAAACVGKAIGLQKKQIEQGIAVLAGVAGRMESVDAGQKFAVIVDYAHTPDALENVLAALQESTAGKLLVVFGATGDRDKSKRLPMGEVAARLADQIYLTDDETYSEDPDAIRTAVYEGIVAADGTRKTAVIPDRLEAIRTAFEAAGAGDTVLLAGMGHQDYRAMGDKKLAWDEREVARKLLEELK
ncbi:MAG TPA: UDP-N-acetylmuramoyl-L-alanyl-D-glutamate--2,6-diaminopimelate ligase [Candidatus Saccharimonadia bacterium]|nr:UDP-N-acetylmuramoyl-L-alanyl-D-glutamate--2,6-diaminopimelate ligase [Candidatus Saccharimonadia bacterium]